MRVSELLGCTGAGWRPVLELATGGASYGPFPTAAHAETFVCTKERAAEDGCLPHMRAVRVKPFPGTSANIVIVCDWS